MNNPLEYAPAMEAGQAPPKTCWPCPGEKGGRQLSTSSSDTVPKPQQPLESNNCAPSSLRRLWSSLSSIPARLRSRKARSTEQKVSPIVRTLESCPPGYPGLAAFLDSDEGFSVYRRFGFIQSRLLLDKQDRLCKLEEALDALDRREQLTSSVRPRTNDLPEEEIGPRRGLLATIEEQFISYTNLLETSQKMMAMNRPSESDYTSVVNHVGNRGHLLEEESLWVYKKEDLVTLRAGREHAWLDSGIEKMLRWFHCGLVERIFGNEQTRLKSAGEEVYYVRQRINNLANSMITFMVLILLVLPIYLLYHLLNDVADGRSYAICMGVLIVSTLAFSAVLCLFTRAKRHEILAAAAAYCAVLVVFFGNVGTSRNDGRIL